MIFDNTDNSKDAYGSIWYFLAAKQCSCNGKLCQCKNSLVAVIYVHEQVNELIVKSNPLCVKVPHIKVTRKTNKSTVVSVCKISSVLVNVSYSDANKLHYLCEIPNMMESD